MRNRVHTALTLHVLSRSSECSVSTPLHFASHFKKKMHFTKNEKIIGNVPEFGHLYLLGHFNARVGGNHDSWFRVVGHSCEGKLNENGQRLLELCCQHEFSGAILDKSIGINLTSSLCTGLR